MPALTLFKRDAWFPEPVTREVYVERRGERWTPERYSIVALLYPDVIVVDGWHEGRAWFAELKYSATVARQPEALYLALVACTEALNVTPFWSELLRQIELLVSFQPATVREAHSLHGPAAINRGSTGIQHHDIDLPLLLAGFSYSHSRPTATFMRGVYDCRLAKVQDAVHGFLQQYGKTPEGELEFSDEDGRRLYVDCAELRRLARYASWPSEARRAIFVRDEPASTCEAPEVPHEP